VTTTTKVGIIACSGEEIAAGTVARLATRRVLELLRPQSTVTLCLPLFLAGEEQERRFAREHPTITVDGCEKLCAKRGTEQYSGQVAASIVASEVLGDRVSQCHRSAREFDRTDEEAVWILAERISTEVDALAQSAPAEQPTDAKGASCGCSCGSPPPQADLQVEGKTVTMNALPLIFDHFDKQGKRPAASLADELLATVRIYHPIETGEEAAYRSALVSAYQQWQKRMGPT
jgi:hypothetical protein